MTELMIALEQIEKEKGIAKDVNIEAIEKSLLDACKKDFGKSDNVTVNMDRETGAIEVFAAKTVVEEVEDENFEIALEDAKLVSKRAAVGKELGIPLEPVGKVSLIFLT